MRLTDRTIKGIDSPAAGHSITWDSELSGFGLRTTAAGVKSFIIDYATETGIRRRMTLGRWPTLTATAAREKAKKRKAEATLGGDPLEEKREEKRARQAAGTVAELVDDFERRYLSKKRSGAQTARFLRADLLPALGRMKAGEVKRSDIRRLIEAKAERSPISANRLVSAISRLYSWAVEVDICEASPAVKIKATDEIKRDRALSEAEIRTVWERLDSAGRIGPSGRAALKLILVTLARPGEVCGLRWSEIDGDVWELPAERSKNGKAHRIPLCKMALEILAGQKRNGEYVFPSANCAAGHLQRMTLSQGVRRSADHFEIPSWKPHDLRRTAASQIAGLGTPRFILERLLNHSDRSVTGIYDRYQYSAEKRQALERWERKLRAILGQGKAAEVVAIS